MHEPKDTDWMDTKLRPLYMLPTRDPFRPRDTDRLKVKVWKKIFYANGNKKRDGLLTLISEKVFFKIKSIIKGKERH